MTETVYCRAMINHAATEAAIALEVDIYDARCSERSFAWSENGFELQVLPSSVVDWSNLAAIEVTHYDEVTAWARATTGCDAVVFFPVLLRNPDTAAASSDYAPIQLAHSDYTEAYEAMIKDPTHPYHRVLVPSMRRAGISAEAVASCRRILTLQLWRNVGESLIDYPLCFCDCNSVPRDQLAAVRVAEYGGVETQFDAFGLLEPSQDVANRWYTFPQMQHEEVVVFRAFDSDCVADGNPFWTPHCAFRDPHAGNTPRHSVEMRAICLFW